LAIYREAYNRALNAPDSEPGRMTEAIQRMNGQPSYNPNAAPGARPATLAFQHDDARLTPAQAAERLGALKNNKEFLQKFLGEDGDAPLAAARQAPDLLEPA
jgi:hypothetical protein